MPLLFSPNASYDAATAKANLTRKSTTTMPTASHTQPRLSNSQEFTHGGTSSALNSASSTSASRRLAAKSLTPNTNVNVIQNRNSITSNSNTASTISFNKQNMSQLVDNQKIQQKLRSSKRDSFTPLTATSATCGYLKPTLNSSHQPTQQIKNKLQKSIDRNSDLQQQQQHQQQSLKIVSMAPLSNTNLQPQQLIESSMSQIISTKYDSQCACNLCQIDKQTTTIEIVAKRSTLYDHKSDVKLVHMLHYSKLYAQISCLKLYNLMNTDCSVYYDNTAKQPIDTQFVEQLLHVNGNHAPIYDPRYLYLIDCRLDRKKYDQEHINTSIHYTDILSENIYLSPPLDQYTIVVLYDDDGIFLESLITSNSTNKSVQLVQPEQPQQRRKSATLLKRFQTENILFDIRRLLNNYKGTIYILSNGYENFKTVYPFICSNLQIRSTVDRHKYLTIYPNCVLENFLYIGSGIQAKNWKIIRDLNITHIINSSIEHECVFQDVCKYLHVKIEDNLNENIYNQLDSAFLFIENALKAYRNNPDSKEPKVLIHCNMGISRSSSILIAYLIKKYKFCLYSTFNYVKDKRIQIAPNYSFLKQLKFYEESTL